MTDKPKPGFGCKAKPETGEVQIFITADGKPILPGLNAPADHIGVIVAVLLGEAIKASNGQIVQSPELDDVLYVRGIRLALAALALADAPPEIGLVLHAGLARVCIPLDKSKAVELGRALLTIAGSEGSA